MTVLCTQGNQSNFGISVTEHIGEQFIVGINDNKIRIYCYKMSRTHIHNIMYLALPIKLDLKDTSTMKFVMSQKKFLSVEGDGCSGHSGHGCGRSRGSQSRSRDRNGNFIYCSRWHKPKHCPAFGKECNKCHKLNHFQNIYRSSKDNFPGPGQEINQN